MAPRLMSSLFLLTALILFLATRSFGAVPLHSQPETSFVTFESGQVRPLALSPNGQRLFAVNTPDNRLEVFDVTDAGLAHLCSVSVGLEPVAVAVRNDDEVWVVNHLSDSVSVVTATSTDRPLVSRTLLVGDEPRDIVFAGPGRSRAFITAAHRGQNVPFDPQLTTPGVGRADVWVFDANHLDDTLGGTPLTIVTLFGDTPRALAVTPDGSTVLAAVFHSGNQTTTVSEGAVCDGGESVGECTVRGVVMPGGLPGPDTNVEGAPRPETGLIVKFDPMENCWEDQLHRDWSPAVRFGLPDKDVFAIDANATPPVEITNFAGVGTVLFNMAVNPASGKVYVSNTDARNEVRFEGPGLFGGSTVRGHLHESRITIIDPMIGTVTPRHLNKHIDYAVVPSPPGVKERSLATPLEIAVTANGDTLYVAAFGSSAIGVFRTAALENNTFAPDAANQIRVQGGGPSGLVLDEARGRLYVLTRFDNAVSVIDTATRSERSHVQLYNPEPPAVRQGRPFLYDARLTSSNGEASCASCHVFADMDDLGWDLGNPDASVIPNPNFNRAPDFEVAPEFHPMKGPMTTQTLRGLANHGPMHWRGDRTGGNDAGGDSFDEEAAYMQFNVAFEGLLGREDALTPEQMHAFADFNLQVAMPPNPIRALDNSLTAQQQAGKDLFFNFPSAGPSPCNFCHVLDLENGFFGTDGSSADAPFFTAFDQFRTLKIPHLRNMYQKVGMFGMPGVEMVAPGDHDDMGDQIRGFGFLHDGSEDTILRHLRVESTDERPGFFFPGGDTQRRNVEQFLLAFDSNLAPVVGQQVTLTHANPDAVRPRINLLIDRALAGECDLTAKARVFIDQGGLFVPRGWYLNNAGVFVSDRRGETPLSNAELQRITEGGFCVGQDSCLSFGAPLTYTCVPPGSGMRIGVDRDADGAFDRDELDFGTDPTDPHDVPTMCPGDCDNDGAVSINELVRMVNIAQDASPMNTCMAGNPNHDSSIAINELVMAAGNAMHGCTHQMHLHAAGL